MFLNDCEYDNGFPIANAFASHFGSVYMMLPVLRMILLSKTEVSLVLSYIEAHDVHEAHI